MTAGPTMAQLAALKWLRNRNGDGVFERNHQVLVAGGDRAPVRRSTWTRLHELGLVEFYQTRRRLRVTSAGQDIALNDVSESV